jgi:methionyl-tRNA formyltransferase
MTLRLLFFGTPEFAVPSLLAMVRSAHTVVGVITQPDRPRGRGQKLRPEAIAAAALDQRLPLLQPERLRSGAFLESLAALQPDLGIVAAYGRILPQELLDLPRLGVVNVHASLLPRWRGAAPVHRAILAGDHHTGITIMRVVLALDAGPMLARDSTAIDPNETSAQLESRLAALGAGLLVETVDRLSRGPTQEVPQDERGATYASKIERGDSPIDWARPPHTLHNQIRGLHPWPLASSMLGGRRVLLLRSVVERGTHPAAPPGTILAADAGGLIVAAGPGAVRLLELQPEGRRAMSARDFLNGTRVAVGDRFNGAMRQ